MHYLQIMVVSCTIYTLYAFIYIDAHIFVTLDWHLALAIVPCPFTIIVFFFFSLQKWENYANSSYHLNTSSCIKYFLLLFSLPCIFSSRTDICLLSPIYISTNALKYAHIFTFSCHFLWGRRNFVNLL